VADAAQIAGIVGGFFGGLVGVGVLVEKVRSAFTAAGHQRESQRETALPPEPIGRASMASLPGIATAADLEAVRRDVAAVRGTQDQMVVKVERLEEDAQEQERILRGVEGNVIRIGERLKLKMEAIDGKRGRDSS